MIQNNNIESNYTRSTTLQHRQQFAQFFTPPEIADCMATWLLKNPNLDSVLEPAFGLGVFSRALMAQKSGLSIRGYDSDCIILNAAQKEFCRYKNVQLLCQDYMYNDWENKYDGIICNPPYFKFHDYDNKSVIKEIEKKLSCKLTGFTNLYTLFLLKSIHQLKPNGRCAYIVPSEFLNSDYGKLIKLYLLKTQTLRHIIVFDFEENVFDDALTTACIILCANDKKTDNIHFTNISSKAELKTIVDIIENYPKSLPVSKKYHLSDLDPNIKWKKYYQSSKGVNFKKLVPFCHYAKVVRGIATGANDYFTFNISKAQKYGIKDSSLLPCICKCADVKNSIFTIEDFYKLKNDDKKVFLLNATNACDSNVVNYLRKGEKEEIHKKYLTSSRSPWYALENRPPAPIWVSVFNRRGLRFIRNAANISNLTTFHCVYPQKDLFSNISIDLLFAYLLTDTARLIFEDNSREYGNGLQKFEPNDLNKGMMIDLESLTSKQKNQIEHAYTEYIKTKDDCLINQINEMLVNDFAT